MPELQQAVEAMPAELVQACALIEACASMFRPDFMPWLKNNWHIWARFESEADRVWCSGRHKYSARTLIEYIRHDTFTREVGGEYKVNNSFVPDIGRLYGMNHAGRQDFFECRVMRQAGIRTMIRGARLEDMVAA